jgi:hypothetical protein
MEVFTMARKSNNKKRKLAVQKSEDQKEFVDPTVVAAVGWFSFKAIAQSIIGWLGLTYFLKWKDKWSNRGKIEEKTTELSPEESASSS